MEAVFCKFLFLGIVKDTVVEVDIFKSSHQIITTGVLQRSILGPLLFLIYTNGMPLSSKLFKFILNADDTSLFSALHYSLSLDISTSWELINREWSRVGEWLIINRLFINISKAKYMIFHPKQVDNLNCLGVVIDKHIS